jgi:hypothetical protein
VGAIRINRSRVGFALFSPTTGVPQRGQKAKSGEAAKPHCGHAGVSPLPHMGQKA